MNNVHREAHQDDPTSTEQPTQLPPGELNPHPKNAEVYDTTVSDRFVTDVHSNGVKQSIKVTSDSAFEEGTVVISGHRRRKAALQADLDTVPVEWLPFDSPEAEVAELHRLNDYRDLKFSERMAMGDDLWDLHNAGHQDFGDTKKQIRAAIGDRIGIGSHESYRKAQTVWDAAKNGDERAQGLVETIDGGDQSIHGAATELQADRDAIAAIEGSDTAEDDGDDEHQTFGEDVRVIDNTTDDSDYYASLRRVVEWYNNEYEVELATDEHGILRSAVMIAEEGGG